jgi:hypothetical protein
MNVIFHYQAFNMPENVGFPFGATDNAKYLRLEMHYNNPTMVSSKC